jgi:hypothetical protein
MTIIPERSPLVGDPPTKAQQREMWREEYRRNIDAINAAREADIAEAARQVRIRRYR